MGFNNTALVPNWDPPQGVGMLAAKIAYYNFEWRFITLVIFNSVDAIGLHVFLKNYQESLVLKFGKFIPVKRRYKVHQFVIFGEDAMGISETLRWLVKSNYDTNAIYLIICAGAGNEMCDEQRLFQTLAQNYILNVVVLTRSNETREPLAYSYELALDGVCENSLPKLIDLKSDHCFNNRCLKSLFTQKLTNFHRCLLTMSTIEQPPFMYLYGFTKNASGADGEVMKLVAEMLNATLVLKIPADRDGDWGHYSNNNWTGSLGEVYNGHVHGSVCSAPLTSDKYGNFQISFEYYSMDIVWATKQPPRKAPWESILHPLNVHLRVVLLFTFISIILLNSFTKSKIWRKVRIFFDIDPPKHNLLFYSWILFLGMPVPRTPVKRSFILIVYAWIWFCFVIRSAYLAGLIDAMKYPAYEERLQSFQDVLTKGFSYGGLPSLRDFFVDEPEIYNNWINIELRHLAPMLDEMLDGNTNFVLASNKAAILHRLKQYNGTKQLQIIPEKIVNSPTVVYFKRFSPVTAPMSYILRRAYEGGFIQRQYQRFSNHDTSVKTTSPNPGDQKLTLNHFAGCFAILFLGWVLAFVYFLIELVCGNLKDEIQETTNIYLS